MDKVIIREKDAIAMKLLHFFITEQGYTPIVVHGVQDEIWLENMKSPYSIVRIMTGHIHNMEQLEFDLFKTQSLIKRIKRKTLRFKMKTLSIFIDLEERVKLSSSDEIECINVVEEKDLDKYEEVNQVFPDISSKLKHSEEGLELFTKITNDINEATEKEAQKTEDVFKLKTPYVTIALIVINILFYLISVLTDFNSVATTFALNATAVRTGEIYRLITATFMHSGLLHIGLNMYALYIIGTQLESFYGHYKFLIIYLFSGIMGSLLSMAFLGKAWSLGASGAIFGLFGALLYFGYHYRAYLGNVIKTQILPIILLNLLLGFAMPGIDQFAHLGGLAGGALISMALGVKYKTSKSEQINGIVLTLLAFIFLIFIAFFYSIK